MKDLYYVLMKNNLGNASTCRKLIKQGKITVNGEVIKDHKYPVKFSDQIIYQQTILKAQPFTYIMLNKPKGYICANRDLKYPCVIDLITNKDCYCLGRLDKDTTGLLILTDDHSLSKKLLLPSNHFIKKYLVETQKKITNNLKEVFLQGIIIDHNIKCLPAEFEMIDDFHCYLSISEGKYHQIKKMFKSLDNEVVNLKRIEFGALKLDERLKEGEFRDLTNQEILSLL